jgi:hypothetical protein
MTLSTFLAAVRRQLLGSAWGSLARGAWCRRQRRHLLVPGHSIVWLRGDAVAWAEWGARRGYFEVQHMGNLPYLSALTVPAV